MKKIIGFGLIVIGFVVLVSFQKNENQVPYFSTMLSPYSEELDIISSDKSTIIETYTSLETGFGGFFQVYMGTGKQGNTPLYWVKMEALLGSSISYFTMDRDSLLNVCSDTIRTTFRGDTEMTALEIIHNLSTNEIQYIWLDENNNRSENAKIIPLNNPLQQGKTFPDLTVEQLNGGKLTINDLIGKTVVINWWATHCGPCIAEMPGFNKLVEQYKQNPNVVFIAIADNNKEQLTRFFENREFNYIQTLGNEDVLKIFGNSYPKNIVINSAGKIYYYSNGGHPDKYLEIEKVLKGLLE